MAGARPMSSPLGLLVSALLATAQLLTGVIGSDLVPPPATCTAGIGSSKYDLEVLNLTIGKATNWCRNQTRCAGFMAAAGCSGSDIVEVHFKDSWGIRRAETRCSDINPADDSNTGFRRATGWSTWHVPGPRPKPPYPTPPNPCLPSSVAEPQYHISNLGVGPHDLNSIFYYKGMWHVMHQANWTDWAHLVSADLAHWTRLPSALSPNGDWDGSLTLTLPGGQPTILFDCFNVADCRPPASIAEQEEIRAQHVARMSTLFNDSDLDSSDTDDTVTKLLRARSKKARSAAPQLGDPPIVGVARPVDPSDPNLTLWRKDPRNPIRVENAHGNPSKGPYAGPSTMWIGSGGAVNMLMSLGHATARYSSHDPGLHNWSVADPSFYPTNSGPSEFFPLPKAAPMLRSHSGELLPDHATLRSSVVWKAPEPTHVLAGIMPPRPYRGGTPWYVLGHYDEASGKFFNTSTPMPFDASDLLIYSQLHSDRGRMLFMGWWNVGKSCLTVPREITFDNITGRLRSLPAAELAALRQKPSLRVQHKPLQIAPSEVVPLVPAGNRTGTSWDLEASVVVPEMQPLSFGMAILASADYALRRAASHAEVSVRVSIGALDVHNQFRDVNVSAGAFAASLKSNANSSMSFSLPASVRGLGIRVLADKSLVEVFIGEGLAVLTVPVLSPGGNANNTGLYIFATETIDDSRKSANRLTIDSSEAWRMGCGWASYP